MITCPHSDTSVVVEHIKFIGENMKFLATFLLIISIPAQSSTKNDLKEEQRKSRYLNFWGDKEVWKSEYKENLSDVDKVAGLSKVWMEAKLQFCLF